MILVGAGLGLVAGASLWFVFSTLAQLRGASLRDRVLPYVRNVRAGSRPAPSDQTRAFTGVFGPLLTSASIRVGRVLGGDESVRRRLLRANAEMDVSGFRTEQVLWGVGGFALAAIPSSIYASYYPARAAPLLLTCLGAFVLGVLLRENRLSAQVRAREERVQLELPTIAELLALSVAAGESPVAALKRVSARSHGELTVDLRRVLGEIQTGTPLAAAFDQMATWTGLASVARFAEAIAIASERGTPLTDVLHAQAGDVREAGRRALIEAGARREVAMIAPVVFFVLPVVVLFVFYPGWISLGLVVN